MKAIQFSRVGAPDVLEAVELPTPRPRPGEVLVEVRAAGVNLSDILMRQGRYAVQPTLPAVPGNEASGVVAAIGEGVKGLAVGDRVAVSLFAAGVHVGGYASHVVIDAAYATPLPPALSFEAAAALMVQGTTALALVRHTDVAGRSVLVSAAGGGVGTLLVQLLRRAGARQVIAAASTEDKRHRALALGADAAVDYTAAGWVDEVRALTGGVGPDVVFESVGGQVTTDGFAMLAPRGALVVYGALNIQAFAFGVPELRQLIFRNQSLLGFAAVPMLTPQALHRDLDELFGLAGRGELKVQIGARLALTEAAQAHRLLESRRTVGKLILRP